MFFTYNLAGIIIFQIVKRSLQNLSGNCFKAFRNILITLSVSKCCSNIIIQTNCLGKISSAQSFFQPVLLKLSQGSQGFCFFGRFSITDVFGNLIHSYKFIHSFVPCNNCRSVCIIKSRTE